MKKTVFLLVIFVMFNTHAEIYHWVDDHGVSHFGDRPKTNKPVKKIKIQKHKVTTPYIPESPSNTGNLKDEISQSIHKKKTKIKKTNLQKIRAKQCVKSMMDLTAIKHRKPVFIDDEFQLHAQNSEFSDIYKGTRTYLSELERQLIKTTATNFYHKHCNKNKESAQLENKLIVSQLSRESCRIEFEKLVTLKEPNKLTANSDIKKQKSRLMVSCAMYLKSL